MSDFFSELLADAEAALQAVGPVITAAQTLAPVVETLAPSTIPVINAVQAGAASIEAVAPGAVTAATTAIAAARQIVAAGSPEVQQLASIFGSLFAKTSAPQAAILTPKTTAATAS